MGWGSVLVMEGTEKLHLTLKMGVRGGTVPFKLKFNFNGEGQRKHIAISCYLIRLSVCLSVSPPLSLSTFDDTTDSTFTNPSCC